MFLIAVNPYRNVPIYEDEAVRWYRGQKRQDRPPHIFSVADGAYQALMMTRRSQSILITGESGAGKTENTKRVIHYLTSISSSAANNITGSSSLEQQLILTNPILESFGNAQTVRNNNSSRFGKFIRIDFDPSGGNIVGASIEKYLLEKSRVTHRATSERNFHIFYQLIQGAPNELLTELKLMKGSKRPTCKDFAYVSNSNSVVNGINDEADFENLKESLKVVGIDEMESKDLFRILAVILLLGNLKLTEDSQGQAHISESEDSLIDDICELLGVNGESFKSGLLNPIIRAGKEIVTQAREKEQVQRSIEALYILRSHLYGVIQKLIQHSSVEFVLFPVAREINFYPVVMIKLSNYGTLKIRINRMKFLLFKEKIISPGLIIIGVIVYLLQVQLGLVLIFGIMKELIPFNHGNGPVQLIL